MIEIISVGIRQHHGMSAIIDEFLAESVENLDSMDQDLVALEKDPSSTEVIERIFRTIHTIKGTCGFLAFGKLEAVTHSAETVLAHLRDGHLTLTPGITTTLLKAVDCVREILAHIEKEKIDYRHNLSARVENLFTPLLDRLKETGGHLAPTEIQRLDEALQTIVEEDLSTFENNLAKLSPREFDICQMIKQGHSSKEMADQLGLSTQTIHKHRRTIRRKLELTNKDINLAAFLRSKNRPA